MTKKWKNRGKILHLSGGRNFLFSRVSGERGENPEEKLWKEGGKPEKGEIRPLWRKLQRGDVENQDSLIFLTISDTMPLKEGSFSMRDSTFWIAYTMVEWSRVPNSWPMDFMGIPVMVRTT